MYKNIEIFIYKYTHLYTKLANNGHNGHSKQKVTLSIDSKVYDSYKQHCEENAIMLSKKIELFMKKELNEK